MKLLAASALALTLFTGQRPALQDPSSPQSWALLAAELAALADGVAPEVVAQRLPALVPDSAALLFDALGRDELPQAGDPLPLGEREHAALREGARRLGRAAFLRLWSEAAAAGDARRRRTAIELVGLCGTSDDLDTAVRAAAPAKTGAEPDPAALPLLQQAVAALLAREPEALVPLRPAVLHAPPSIAGRLIRAVGDAAGADTLVFLAELLGFDARLELPLLSEIARAARRAAPPFDERLCAQVRAYLVSEDRQVARVAAMTLAELEDEEALPALLRLAAVADPALSGAAFLALEHTTGLSLPRRAERWSSWYQSEQKWASEAGPAAFSDLESPDVPRILGALRCLATHRLERQRSSLRVAQLLEHEDPRVRLEACRTLSALGCRRSVEALRRSLSDADRAVVAAAQQALQALERGT